MNSPTRCNCLDGNRNDANRTAIRFQHTPAAFEVTVMPPESLRAWLEAMTIFVAVAESVEIAGTIAHQGVGGGEGQLRGMAVHHDWQGSGISSKLLERAEADYAQEIASASLSAQANALSAPCAFMGQGNRVMMVVAISLVMHSVHNRRP
jgi:GNAT superfamily N-acetyltransferase